jgi:DNA adenine methylase
MRYPGGKGRCFQHIVSMMPPHAVYIEAFLGGGAVLRNKLPAEWSIGIDLDPAVASLWDREGIEGVKIVNGDAIDFLSTYQFEGDELIYCDPPYLQETRRKKRIYRYEYDRLQHELLLETLLKTRCRVILSGYRSRLYDEKLAKWTAVDFPGDSHIGPRTETVWLNFDVPEKLHDYRFIGCTFRDREGIKRRHDGIFKRIAALPALERNAILNHLTETYSDCASPPLRPANNFGRVEEARR